jgi:hypothetical protein
MLETGEGASAMNSPGKQLETGWHSRSVVAVGGTDWYWPLLHWLSSAQAPG